MNREKFEKLIEEINKAELPSLYHLEDCEFWWEGDNEVGNLLEEGLNVDKHRWYETSTSVYRVGDFFLGVNGPSQMYSESSSWDDLQHEVIAFEMEKVLIVSYRAKAPEK